MIVAWEIIVRWRKLIGVALLLATLVAGYFWWEGRIEARVTARVNADWTAKEEKISAAAEALYQKKLVKALADQKTLMEADAKLAAESAAWEKNHEAAVQKHIGAVLSGVERLRVAVRPPASKAGGRPESTAAAPASEPGSAETAEIMPGVAAAILSIAGDSARDVHDFNELLARYQMIEAACK